MRARLLVFVLVAALALPGRADAWGFEAHHLIMERAIALLPAELRPLFEMHRATVVERVIDPDTWRAAGFADEEPNHFLDLDWEGYGKEPFRELPRDYTAALAKFGRARIQQNGTVPWRTEEMFGNLQRAFQDYGRRGAFGQIDIITFKTSFGWTLSNYRQLNNSIYLQTILRSLEMSIGATAACLVVGYPVAYTIARQRGRATAPHSPARW